MFTQSSPNSNKQTHTRGKFSQVVLVMRDVIIAVLLPLAIGWFCDILSNKGYFLPKRDQTRPSTSPTPRIITVIHAPIHGPRHGAMRLTSMSGEKMKTISGRLSRLTTSIPMSLAIRSNSTRKSGLMNPTTILNERVPGV